MYRRWLIGIGFSSIGAAVLLLPPIVDSLRGTLSWVDRYVLWTVSSLLALGGFGSAGQVVEGQLEFIAVRTDGADAAA